MAQFIITVECDDATYDASDIQYLIETGLTLRKNLNIACTPSVKVLSCVTYESVFPPSELDEWLHQVELDELI